MKTKAQVIEECYREDFAVLKSKIDMETGICSAKIGDSHARTGIKIRQDLKTDAILWMPIKLSRIFHNFGWQGIKDWDPKDGEAYELWFNDGRSMVYEVHPDTVQEAIREYAVLFKKINLSPKPNFIP